MEEQHNSIPPEDETSATNTKAYTEETTGGENINSIEDTTLSTVQSGTTDIAQRKKKNRWGFLLTIFLFGCVVYALWTISNTIGEGNSATFVELMSVVKWQYLLIALAVMLVMMLCDVLKFSVLTRSNGIHLGFKKEATLGLYGKYYSAITPTSTGGQPMQIYYLCKNGVSGAASSSVALMNYTVQMFSSAIVAATVMISCMGYLSAIGNVAVQKTILISGWVGFGINACAPVFMIVVIFKPKFLKWLINLGLIILGKLHIFKNIDERRVKIYKGIDDFAVCSKFIFAHPVKFLQLVLLGCVEPLTQCVYSYLVLLAFCGDSLTNSPDLFFTVAALAMYSAYAVVYIPTPGNAGAYETIFMLAFASISGDVMFWVAIVSRFFNYYVYIVLGIIMNICEFIGHRIIKIREKRKKINDT